MLFLAQIAEATKTKTKCHSTDCPRTSLGHADATVHNGQRVGCLVGDNVDEKLGLAIQLGLVCEALEADLVQRLQRVLK